MRQEFKEDLRKQYHFDVDCEHCSRIEVGCAECEIITELLDEIDRLSGLWASLGLDVAKALRHQRRLGGMQAGIPELACAGQGALHHIAWYVKAVFGDKWEEEVQKI